MTPKPVTPGAKVRVVAGTQPLLDGREGIARRRTIASGRWLVIFNGWDVLDGSPGQAVLRDEEIEVIE